MLKGVKKFDDFNALKCSIKLDATSILRHKKDQKMEILQKSKFHF